MDQMIKGTATLVASLLGQADQEIYHLLTEKIGHSPVQFDWKGEPMGIWPEEIRHALQTLFPDQLDIEVLYTWEHFFWSRIGDPSTGLGESERERLRLSYQQRCLAGSQTLKKTLLIQGKKAVVNLLREVEDGVYFLPAIFDGMHLTSVTNDPLILRNETVLDALTLCPTP